MLSKDLADTLREICRTDEYKGKYRDIKTTGDVANRFDERNEKQTNKAVISDIWDKKTDKRVFIFKAYNHSGPFKNKAASSTFNRERQPHREYNALVQYNSPEAKKLFEAWVPGFSKRKEPIIPEPAHPKYGWIPSEQGFLMKPISEETIESKLVSLRIEERNLKTNERIARKEKRYKEAKSLNEKVKSIRKDQSKLIDMTVEGIATFQRAGEIIRDHFRDKGHRLYYAPPRDKEEMENRARHYLRNIIKLKKEVAGEKFSNHTKEIETLIDEVVTKIGGSESIRNIVHRDFGVHHINTDMVVFDLGEFGLGCEEVDLAVVSNSPLILTPRGEFERKYFNFIHLKYPEYKAEGLGKDAKNVFKKVEKGKELNEAEINRLVFYADHIRMFYRNKIGEAFRVLGTITRNIRKDPEQHKTWMEKYKGLFTEGDLIKHYFGELRSTFRYMLDPKHINYIFHTKEGLDLDSINGLKGIERLVKDLSISPKGRKRIKEYMQDGE